MEATTHVLRLALCIMVWPVAARAMESDVDRHKTVAIEIDGFDSEHNDKFISNSNIKFNKDRYEKLLLSGNLTLISDVPDDCVITAKFFSKSGNTWPESHDAIYTCGFCELLKKSFIPKSIFEHSNFPKECPYEAGDYYVDSFELTYDDVKKFLPPSSQQHRRFHYTISKDEDVIAASNIDFTIQPDTTILN